MTKGRVSWCRLLAFTSVYFLSVNTAATVEVKLYPPAVEELSQTGFDGGVFVYDAKRRTFFTSSPAIIDRRYIPASTFKVFSSLVALELGVVSSKDAVIKWDGVHRSREKINRDLDLSNAFRLSAVPHYQHLVRTVGPSRMQDFVTKVAYGNEDLSGGIDQFWLTGSLRISPREQVNFLRRLYHDDLPFAKSTMASVKSMMVHEEGPGYTLRAKTGWAVLTPKTHTGWWVGWLEYNSNVFFFATVLQTKAPGKTFGDTRLSITREVLSTVSGLDLLSNSSGT